VFKGLMLRFRLLAIMVFLR